MFIKYKVYKFNVYKVLRISFWLKITYVGQFVLFFYKENLQILAAL